MNNLGKNKKLLLAKYPNGLAELDDFITKEVEVPNIVDNELLIQSHYVGVDAAFSMRGALQSTLKARGWKMFMSLELIFRPWEFERLNL